MKKETAIFSAGCFWGVQAIFDQVPGVINTIVGYTGGTNKIKPNYTLVCTGLTGHAEAIKIEFDPKKVTYKKLLKVFWMNHNSTTENRQGPDVGSQYRSGIFYTSEKQKEIAIKSKEEYQKELKNKIITEIVKATEFYPAEEYHQKYYKTHNLVCNIKT